MLTALFVLAVAVAFVVISSSEKKATNVVEHHHHHRTIILINVVAVVAQIESGEAGQRELMPITPDSRVIVRGSTALERYHHQPR